jgi:hypothetical protein
LHTNPLTYTTQRIITQRTSKQNFLQNDKGEIKKGHTCKRNSMFNK